METDPNSAMEPDNGSLGAANADGSAVGALLRASRERVGQDLREVAGILRIRYPYLEAIEQGRYSELPGAAYAQGFVRTYAEHLGLDSEEIIRRFKAETSDAAKSPDLVFPTMVSESVMPGGAMIFIGVVLAALAYGAWYMNTADDAPKQSAVPTLPERLSDMLKKPSAETAEKTTAETTDTKVAETAEKTTTETAEKKMPEATETTAMAAETETVTEAVKPVEAVKAETEAATAPETAPVAEPAAEDAAPEPVAEAPADTPAEESAPTETTEAAAPTEATAAASEEAPAPVPSGLPKIEVRANQASWIQVRDEDAKALVMTRLLRKGDTYQVPDRTGLSLVTGNAGALEILVDGVVVPAVGDAGAVRRRVMLDAEKLLGGTAVSE